MSEENAELSFFGIELIKYYTNHIHGYLSVTICTIGVIANIINMIIFTRKRMVSPINLILASLSFVDFFALLNYYYKAWYFYLKPGANPYVYWYLSHTTARLVQWQIHFAHIFINTGVWLTALVSIWRYVAIAFPLKNLYWGNNKTTCKAIALVFILCLLFYTPALIAKSVLAIRYDELNLTIYLVSFNQTDPLSTYMADADHFIYSICFRFLPSIVIAVLSARLLLIFAKMSENRKNLSASANSNPANLKKEKQMARTTLVLIILSVLCFVTQLPQYILGLSSYFLSVNRHYQYENVLKEIFDILELTNSAIGFFIYLTISEQFRETFKILFHIKSEQQKSVTSTSGNRNQGYSSNQSVDLATASTNV